MKIGIKMKRQVSKHNTHVIFIDNDDSYIRDVLAKFEEVNSYNIKIYSRSKDFFDDFVLIDHSRKEVFIIFLSTLLESDEQNNPIEVLEVLKRIKEINLNTEVIIYSDNDDINIVSAAFHHGAYTFIKKNENVILRIENNIKGIISQKNFLIKKESSKKFTLFFLLFIAGLIISLLIFYMTFPEWFIS
jgi:DNA-binding NtrC family response regulator